MRNKYNQQQNYIIDDPVTQGFIQNTAMSITDLGDIAKQLYKLKYNVIDLQVIICRLSASSDVDRLFAMVGVKKILQIDHLPQEFIIIASIFESSAFHEHSLTLLIELLKNQKAIAPSIIDANGIEIVLSLLQSKYETDVSSALELINLVLSYNNYQHQILKKGGFSLLLAILNKATKTQMIKQTYKAIAMLIGSKRQIYDNICEYLPVLFQIIVSKSPKHSHHLNDIWEIIAYYSEENMKQMQMFITEQFLQLTIKNLKKCQKNSFQCISFLLNYASLGFTQKKILLQFGLRKYLIYPLQDQQIKLQRCACRLILLFLDQTQLVKSVIYSKKTIKSLCAVYQQGRLNNIILLLKSIALLCDSKQIFRLYVKQHIFSRCLQQLKDIWFISQYAELLFSLLLLGEKNKVDGVNIFMLEFEQNEGGFILEKLEANDSEKACYWAQAIINTFLTKNE